MAKDRRLHDVQITGFPFRGKVLFLLFDGLAGLHDQLMIFLTLGEHLGPVRIFYAAFPGDGDEFVGQFAQNILQLDRSQLAKCDIGKDITPFRVLAENAGGYLVNQR